MPDKNSTDKTVLVIAVRGWTTTGDRLLFGRQGGEIRSNFITSLENDLSSAEVWAPDLDMSMFSIRHPESIAKELFRNGPAAPHGLPGLILASSHFLVRISHENKRTLVAACRNLA